MQSWFGEPWPFPEYRAPICEDDRFRVPTPIGEACYWCQEPIQDGDQGVIRPWYEPTSDGTGTKPIHIECDMRQVVGPIAFLEKRCKHAGGTEECHDPTLTAREDALASWRWVHEHGTLA